MEVSDSIRLLIALAALALLLVCALLTWIAIRLEQRHRREGDTLARTFRLGEASGRAKLRTEIQRARAVADEVLVTPAQRRQIADGDEVLASRR